MAEPKAARFGARASPERGRSAMCRLGHPL